MSAEFSRAKIAGLMHRLTLSSVLQVSIAIAWRQILQMKNCCAGGWESEEGKNDVPLKASFASGCTRDRST